MAKTIDNAMQTYCQGLIDLVDSKGDALLPQMAYIAMQSRRHGFSIDPFEQTVSPKPFYLSHAEYELDRFCARFGVSVNKQGYQSQNILNARASFTFHFDGLRPQNKQVYTLPYQTNMRLDKVINDIEITHHHTQSDGILTLKLSQQEVNQAQNPIQPWYPDLPSFKTRQQSFIHLLYPESPIQGYDCKRPQRFTCQCCAFPTLCSTEQYMYCPLCDWMDEPHIHADIPAELDIARSLSDFPVE